VPAAAGAEPAPEPGGATPPLGLEPAVAAVAPAGPSGAAPPAPPPAVARPEGLGRLEATLGGTWLNRVGALVLVLGIAFFLKYAFENEWVGPAGRVAIGLLAGAGLLLLGERLQRAAYRVPAQGLAGAGIAALYLSAYAAH
jgi:uncharacterized membrane protein